MRRVAIFSVVALAAIGIAFAVVPFHLFQSDPVPVSGLFYGVNEHCSAPIVSAFRGPADGGWFGYAPLTSTPMDNNVHFPTCRAAGRRRLSYGGMFLLAALVIAVAIRKARNEQGPSPNLAIS